MRMFYYVKTTLKGMVSSGVVTIVYFILFPMVLAGFMGFVMDMTSGSELKVKNINVQIIDEDKSELSKSLEEFIKSEEVSEVVTLVEEKPDVELMIKKGYEENALALNKDSITINRKTESMEASINTLKIILDNYHQGLYVSLAGGDINQLNKVIGQSIIENVMVDKPQKENFYEKMAVSMLGFVIAMLLVGLLQGGYSDLSINLDKRAKVAPISKLQYLLYDSAGIFIYAFIIIGLYVFFFRFTGITFKGSILGLLSIVTLATVFVVSIAKCITTVFGGKVGKVISVILFIMPIIGGEIFSFGSNAVALLTPTHYINNVINIYILNGNLQGTGKWIGIIVITSLVLFSIAMVKEWLGSRRKLCV
ncbi:MAG: ABC transporter permease [Clostridium sp.]|uniref:ABC transporter permease n=1 Tax=Clostridium sp. TaxID=1506 RepID=UPI0030253295